MVLTPSATTPSVDHNTRRRSSTLRIDTSHPNSVQESDKDHTQKVRKTLEQGWRNAVVEFRKKTVSRNHPNGRELGKYSATKQGVLDTLKPKRGEDGKDTKKRNDLLVVVERIVNCVELVGGIAAQAAAMVFSPAGMCFNALEILLSVPKELKNVADDLQALFNEVSSFLTNFQVLKRADDKALLDPLLITSTNDILLALVDVCALSTGILDSFSGSFKAALGSVFLKDNKCKAALESFKDLVEKQNQLTATMTLEAVLQDNALTEEVKRRTKRMEPVIYETNAAVKYLQADSVESKNTKAIREVIVKIDKGLAVSDALATGPIEELKRRLPYMLEETIELLEKNEQYQEWKNSNTTRAVLFLAGPSSTGKTHLLSALQQQIDKTINSLEKGDRSIYLTYYSFRRTDDTGENIDGNFGTPLHSALRVVAAQVARQSTGYAKTLSEHTDRLKTHKTLRAFWDALKFDDFNAPPKSVLYMFFDGLDQLKSGLRDLAEILKDRDSRKHRKDDNKLRFKIIFTGTRDTHKKLQAKFDLLDVTAITKELVRRKVKLEMENQKVFQDTDLTSTERRAKLLDRISDLANGSFGIASQKVLLARKAIDEDKDYEELFAMLESDIGTSYGDEGKLILDKVVDTVSVQHREQLRELLLWSSWAARSPKISELEAALFLLRQKEPLEPLEVKIRTRFDDVLSIFNESGQVVTNEAVETHLFEQARQRELTNKEKSAKITINVSIENADEPEVKRFFWELNAAISDGIFDFSSLSSRSDAQERRIPISISELDAHYTVCLRCFKALNDDDLRERVRPLIAFASSHLAYHLYSMAFIHYDEHSFSDQKLSKAQMKDIGHGLINFLCDRDCLEYAWEARTFDRNIWLDEIWNVHIIAQMLTDPDFLDELAPRDRRWVNKNTSQQALEAAYAPFLQAMVETAAYKWLEDKKGHSDPVECFDFVDAFLETRDWRLQVYVQQSLPGSPSGPSRPTSQVEIARSGLDYTADHMILDASLNGADQWEWKAEEPWKQDDAREISESDTSEVKPSAPTGSIGPDDSAEVNSIRIQSKRLENKVTAEELSAAGFLNMLRTNRGGDDEERSQEPEDDDARTNDHFSQETTKAENQSTEVITNTDDRAHPLNKSGTMTSLRGLRNDGQAQRNEHDSVGGTRANPPVLTLIERVERAKNWALQSLGIQPDAFAYDRIASVLLGFDDTAAEKYFKLAQQSEHTTTGAIGLAKIYEDRDERDKAIEVLKPALDVLLTRKFDTIEGLPVTVEQSESAAEHYDQLFKCLDQATDLHEKLRQYDKAIELMEEAVRNVPHKNSVRMHLMDLLCQTGQHIRAQEIFDAWKSPNTTSTDRTEPPGKHLLEFIRESPDCAALFNMMFMTKGSSLYQSMITTIYEAIHEAEVDQRREDQGYLSYAQGLILSLGQDEEPMDKALELWEQCIDLHTDAGCSDDVPKFTSSMVASMHHFDRAKTNLSIQSTRSQEEKKVMYDQLKADISDKLLPVQKNWRISDTPLAYVVSFARLSGQELYAKKLLQPDMSEAIELLSDDDEDNDWTGILVLVKTLVRYGDIVGALSAWSLLDRRVLRKAQLQTLQNSKLPGEQSTNSTSGGASGKATTQARRLGSPNLSETLHVRQEESQPGIQPVEFQSQVSQSMSPPRLPEGWIAHLDRKSGHYYYIHLPTESTQWEFPKDLTPLNLNNNAVSRTQDVATLDPPDSDSNAEATNGDVSRSTNTRDWNQGSQHNRPVISSTLGEAIAADPGQDNDSDSDMIVSATRAGDSTWLWFPCKGCGSEMMSWEVDKAQWWCKFCPDNMFCTTCHDELIQGQLHTYWCNPKHEFYRMQHDKYTEEEVEGRNVKIEWELKENEDGTERQRVGGRIVSMTEWVEILRKEWDIQDMKTGGRIQK